MLIEQKLFIINSFPVCEWLQCRQAHKSFPLTCSYVYLHKYISSTFFSYWNFIKFSFFPVHSHKYSLSHAHTSRLTWQFSSTTHKSCRYTDNDPWAASKKNSHKHSFSTSSRYGGIVNCYFIMFFVANFIFLLLSLRSIVLSHRSTFRTEKSVAHFEDRRANLPGRKVIMR